MKKIVGIIGIIFLFSNHIYAQEKITKAIDGICIFVNSPKMFEFVKTNEWHVNNDRLIHILSYQVGYYILYRFHKFSEYVYDDNYLDTLSYGYNESWDNRTTKVYYCNCKLLFTDSTFDENKLEERYDKNPYFNKKYNYLYKGKPVRFHNSGLLGTPVDSVILFHK